MIGHPTSRSPGHFPCGDALQYVPKGRSRQSIAVFSHVGCQTSGSLSFKGATKAFMRQSIVVGNITDCIWIRHESVCDEPVTL